VKGKPLRLENEMNVLGYVRAVQIVVVLHGATVVVVDLPEKVQVLLIIHRLLQIVVLEQSSGHEGQRILPADLIGELEDVKLEGVEGHEVLGVLFDHGVESVGRKFFVDFIVCDLEEARLVR